MGVVLIKWARLKNSHALILQSHHSKNPRSASARGVGALHSCNQNKHLGAYPEEGTCPGHYGNTNDVYISYTSSNRNMIKNLAAIQPKNQCLLYPEQSCTACDRTHTYLVHACGYYSVYYVLHMLTCVGMQKHNIRYN